MVHVRVLNAFRKETAASLSVAFPPKGASWGSRRAMRTQ